MDSRNKYIGIESRVHFDVLEAAIVEYLLNDNLDKESCLKHIKQFTKGENRAGKILKHISVIIAKNSYLLGQLRKQIKDSDYYHFSTDERRALLLCFFCIGFPITSDILTALAQGFKVQNTVSKQVIIHKIGAMYGGNRAMHIAVTEIVPFLIECGVIQRIKLGLYSFNSKLVIKNKFIAELIIYTDIFLSGSKSTLVDDLGFKPWYSYFDISSVKPDNFSLLISKKDSAVGKGYLTVK
jgi:transposase-like protein